MLQLHVFAKDQACLMLCYCHLKVKQNRWERGSSPHAAAEPTAMGVFMTGLPAQRLRPVNRPKERGFRVADGLENPATDALTAAGWL